MLEDEAAPAGPEVPLAWDTESFSKLAVVTRDVTAGEARSSRAEAAAFAEAEGFGAFLLEPAVGSTVPSATKQTGEALEIRAGPAGEGAFSCLQLLGS